MISKQLQLTTLTLVMQQATSASIGTSDDSNYDIYDDPEYCPDGYERTGENLLHNGWCIKLCEEGYTAVGGFCYQDCPTNRGFTDMSVACGKPPLKNRNPVFHAWWWPVPAGRQLCGAFWAYTC